MKFSIILQDINKIKSFVEVMKHTEAKVILQQEELNIDLKSILGILSLDLNQPITIEVLGDAKLITDWLSENGGDLCVTYL